MNKQDLQTYQVTQIDRTFQKKKKQADTTLSRNRQIFPTIQSQVGEWCHNDFPGWENIVVQLNPFHAPDRNPTQQKETMTHQESSVDACPIS